MHRVVQVTRLALLCLAPAAVPAAASSLPDPLAAGWEGEPVCERLHEDHRARILRCTFAPGIGHERHYHPPHLGYVIAGGTMRITDGDGTRVVEVPTGIVFDSPEGVEWHEVLNVGEETATYLIIETKAPAAKQGAEAPVEAQRAR